MSIEYCEPCDWEWDSDKHEACSKCHGEPPDDEPTAAQHDAYFAYDSGTSPAERRDRDERGLREAGRR